jgi:hypothetical protein
LKPKSVNPVPKYLDFSGTPTKIKISWKIRKPQKIANPQTAQPPEYTPRKFQRQKKNSVANVKSENPQACAPEFSKKNRNKRKTNLSNLIQKTSDCLKKLNGKNYVINLRTREKSEKFGGKSKFPFFGSIF